MKATVIKRDGRRADYDESNVVTAITRAGLNEKKALAISKNISRAVSRKKAVTVSFIGDLIETSLMKAGHYEVCRTYIAYRIERRGERMERASILGGVDESLKRMRPSTLRELRSAGSDVHEVVKKIQPDCAELILSGKLIPDDIIIREAVPNPPYMISMPHGMQEQMEVMKHATKFALYVDWNRTGLAFRDAFKAVCSYTGCRIRDSGERWGGMLDLERIPEGELAETAKKAAEFLSKWDGASGPGIIIPPGMDHEKIHKTLYEAVPDLIPTGVYGKADKIWGDTPRRGGCPECGGEIARTESCSSCSCGWSACST